MGCVVPAICKREERSEPDEGLESLVPVGGASAAKRAGYVKAASDLVMNGAGFAKDVQNVFNFGGGQGCADMYGNAGNSIGI